MFKVATRSVSKSKINEEAIKMNVSTHMN